MVVGVHFDLIAGFNDKHQILFWEILRERYPELQTQPRLFTIADDFDELPKPEAMVPRIVKPGPGRFWLSVDGHRAA